MVIRCKYLAEPMRLLIRARTKLTTCSPCRFIHVLCDCSRPGILVLINNGDWELQGQGDYVLQDGDEVVFISTLHGG